jgi:glycosyltransferase involved in cell wall biosynthesis
MITYNHEAYLREAIEGVLGQQTDFEFELVIGEDCSTDKTREIALGFQERFSNRVRVLCQERNQGANRNLACCYQSSSAEFVALCEGDDRWIAPDKLQRQVDFLRAKPDFSVCFHDVLPFQQDTTQWPMLDPKPEKDVFELSDLMAGNLMHTCSVLYRRRAAFEFPQWFFDTVIGDIPLHAFHAETGKIGYIDRVMAAYRMHDGGTYSQIGLIEKCAQGADMLQKLDAHFEHKFHAQAKTYEWRFATLLAREHETRGEFEIAERYRALALHAA